MTTIQLTNETLMAVTVPMFLFEVAEDPEGVEYRCVMANQAALETTGFSEKEVLAKTLGEIVPEDVAALTAEKFGQVVETGEPIHWELTLDLPAGDALTFEISNSPVFEDGRCTHIVTLSREVTTNRAVLTELRQSEERFRHLFEQSPLALQQQDCTAVGAWLDSVRETGVEDLRSYLAAHPEEIHHGIESIKILHVNSAMMSMYEAPNREYLLGRPKDHLTDDVLRSYVERFLAIWEGSISLQTELTATTFKGNRIHCVLHWSAPSTNGGLDLARGVISLTDLTDLRLAREQSDRVRDEFLAGMSHELRTPLNTIIGLNALLEKQTFGPLNNKQNTYTTEIGKSSQHLLSLINDVLDLERIDALWEEIEIAPINLLAVIDGAVGMLHETALAKGIQIRNDASPDTRAVFGDERRLKQVLVNLLSNAVKFTPEGGLVGVETKYTPNQVNVSVCDTGPGIPERHLDLLFRPYTQIDATLSREYEGSGLGLALSQRLMGLHGGSISVESTEGEGSRFVMRWPRNPPSRFRGATEEISPLTTPAASLPSPSQTTTVLLVEDNIVNRMMLSDHLEAQNMTVHIADDGFGMIEQANVVKPDLILVDVQLPRMDGLTATRLLKMNPETRDIPCVALTALAMRGDKERCIEAGCVAYMDKPVDLDEVVRLIVELTSSTD